MTTFVVCGLFCLEVRYSQVVYFWVVYCIGPVNLRQMGQRTIHLKGNEVVPLRSRATERLGPPAPPCFLSKKTTKFLKL